MSDSAGRIAELLKRTRQLYSLPAVAIEVLQQTNDPAVDAARLKTCIEHDPALTAKVLRVVNSSLFGLSRQVLDLSQALGLLGIKPLKLLVLGFSLPEPLFAGIAGDLLGRFWKRSLTRAVAASEISQRLWHRPGDEAFIAGLLMDLGQLVLIQGLGSPYVSLVRRALADGADLAELERAAMGFDHRQLTAGLLSDWGLPLSLSAGASSVALPPRNFVPDDLVERAERCLYGAQRAGGNCLKSMEL